MRYSRYDIVKVPFPFTDKPANKFRPALVISDATKFNNLIEHSVMAMITSAKHSNWPLDTLIKDLASAGLPVSSVIRLKLFTLDHRLIVTKLGYLSNADQIEFDRNFRTMLGC